MACPDRREWPRSSLYLCHAELGRTKERCLPRRANEAGAYAYRLTRERLNDACAYIRLFAAEHVVVLFSSDHCIKHLFCIYHYHFYPSTLNEDHITDNVHSHSQL